MRAMLAPKPRPVSPDDHRKGSTEGSGQPPRKGSGEACAWSPGDGDPFGKGSTSELWDSGITGPQLTLVDSLPVQNPSDESSRQGSADPSAWSPGERGVVTAASLDSPNPVPLPPFPSPSAPAVEPNQPKELTENQRAKRITDAYYAVEPMSSWNAVAGIVRHAIGLGKYTDEQIQSALLRLAADNRAVTRASLGIEMSPDPARADQAAAGTART